MTDTINVTIGTDEINVIVEHLSQQAYVNADSKFYLDGLEGFTYLKYNSATERVELWVKGVKQAEWGAFGGSPFG